MMQGPLHSARPISAALRSLPWLIALAALLGGLGLQIACASEALVLTEDDARVLKFDKMKRVWVTDPSIVDVVVSGYRELLVYSKQVGRTKLYVWDAAGRHEYAVEVRRSPGAAQVARELSNVLGPRLKYTVVDDRTVMVEGEVATEADRERVTKVVEAKSAGTKVIEVVTVRNAGLSPVENYQRAYQRLFPPTLSYTAVDDRTLVIEGDIATATEARRMEQVLAATRDIKVINLARCLEGAVDPSSTRLAGLKQALGAQYEYLSLDGDVLVISGQAATAAEKDRVDKIVSALSGDLKVVNAVSLVGDTQPAADRYVELLRPLLGSDVTFRPVGDKGLVVEGTVASLADEQRVKQILTLVGSDVEVVNLVTSGPRTPAERVVWALRESLGAGFEARLVAEDTVLVEGTAASAEEKDRVDKVVAAAGEGAKVVNLVSVQTGAASAEGPAARYAAALRAALGNDLIYRTLDDKTLLVEGEVPTAGDKERAAKILSTLGGDVKLLDLITVRPGPDAMLASAAARRAQTLAQVLGPDYLCTPVDETTVLVQGVAPGEAEATRLSKVIEQLAGEIRLVNMIVPEAAAAKKPPSERAREVIATVLPEALTLVSLDDKTLLIEGIVANTIEKQRVERIAEAASKTGGVNVLSLVLTDSESKTTAARRVEGLRKILGDKYNYIVWDDETVLVEGDVESQAELERVRKVLEAANKDWQVSDLVTMTAPATGAAPDTLSAQPLIARLQDALGTGFRVWRLKDRKIIVEGSVPDAAGLDRVTKLLEAFSDEADIVNLVTVSPAPGISADDRAAALREVLGAEFQVRTLQGRAVVVDGVAPTKAAAERARSMITALGTDVPVVDLITIADPAKRQVVVHLTVMSITRGGAKRLGVDWGQLVIQDNQYVFGDQPIMMRLEGGIETFSELVANVRALTTDDQAQILAQPNLVVNDGERAELVVGGEVPIPIPTTGTTGGATVAIEYKQYGVVLRFTPTIQADGSLLMDMEPEVSSIDYATQVSISGFAVPGFKTNKVKTKVNMPDGGTLMLGGLIQHEQTKSVSAVPFISKLPIIGELFKNQSFVNKTSELVILVTPEVVRNTKS